jgi:hypothetical protein
MHFLVIKYRGGKEGLYGYDGINHTKEYVTTPFYIFYENGRKRRRRSRRRKIRLFQNFATKWSENDPNPYIHTYI